MMYSLSWSDFSLAGSRGGVIGDLESLFQVWFHVLKDRQWDSLELVQLGHCVVVIEPDTGGVAWWRNLPLRTVSH